MEAFNCLDHLPTCNTPTSGFSSTLTCLPLFLEFCLDYFWTCWPLTHPRLPCPDKQTYPSVLDYTHSSALLKILCSTLTPAGTAGAQLAVIGKFLWPTHCCSIKTVFAISKCVSPCHNCEMNGPTKDQIQNHGLEVRRVMVNVKRKVCNGYL